MLAARGYSRKAIHGEGLQKTGQLEGKVKALE